MSKVNKIIGKVVKFGDNIIGHSAKRAKTTAEILEKAKNLGAKGVPDSTILRAKRISNVAQGRSFQTRVKTGLVVGGAVGGSLSAVRANQIHEDNKILRRIDSMYDLR